MAVLSIPDVNFQTSNPKEIHAFMSERGIFFDQWSCEVIFNDDVSSDEILNAYQKDLQPFMTSNGYKSADVISLNALTENYALIRTKFNQEHTHSEDEIRFFVDGKGLFWFNLAKQPVFNILCEKGDLISVPAGTKHWFDAGVDQPFVKAIRIFIDSTGWVPVYTDSLLENRFANFKFPDGEK